MSHFLYYKTVYFNDRFFIRISQIVSLKASLYGRADIAELLIRSGASVSALTERRQSCLHLLAHQTAQRYVDTAKILLKYHVNPNTLDDDGLAPLHRASVEIVEVLVAVSL